MVAARVRTEPRFEVESRQRLFDGEAYRSITVATTRRWFSVAPDDERVTERDPGLDAGDLVMIRNWFQELEGSPSGT